MDTVHDMLHHCSQMTPLAACVTLAFSFGAHARALQVAPHNPPMTLTVTNCADDGSDGSLRAVVSRASDGYTIDMRALACGKITLVTGAIQVDVDDLTLEGPGMDRLSIDGHLADRVIVHDGAGTLGIEGLTIDNGMWRYIREMPYPLTQGGGCVFSSGSVLLADSRVSGCGVLVASPLIEARGGGIYAVDGVSMYGSQVDSNTVESAQSSAAGGGVYTPGLLTANQSVISGNTAGAAVGISRGGGAVAGAGNTVSGAGIMNLYATSVSDNVSSNEFAPYGVRGIHGAGAAHPTAESRGGGLYATGEVTIANCTIAGNTANSAAGLFMRGDGAVGAMSVVSNSTISGNHAQTGGGLWAEYMQMEITNSTIAFNAASPAGGKHGAGLAVYAGSLDLESTVVADNTDGDFSASGIVARHAGDEDDILAQDTTLTGAHDLIGYSDVPVPTDTISANPMLGPLQYNGGPTLTHALLPGSPAIDAGSNLDDYAFDQRGQCYPRVVGAAADIGAYEVGFREAEPNCAPE